MTTNEPTKIQPTVQLRIPGPWTSPGALNDALKAASLPWVMDEEHFIDSETGGKFEWGVSEHDDDISRLFAFEGRASTEELERIASHKVKVHLSGPGGSIEAARAIIDAATALLGAGGYGVFVDNSGAAHTAGDWYRLAGDPNLGGMYWAFVTLAGDEKAVWSVGMHCLGFRDAELPDAPSKDAAADVLHNFLGYSYQSGNKIHDGDPLTGEDGPEFRVRHVACDRFPVGTTFHNPYGLWRLEKFVEGDVEHDE